MSTSHGDRRDPWLGIELRHLAALSAIESEGTFSDAALSLGYVQSAVSGQLAMLERLIGTRLVERSRGPGPQQLTPAGQLLLEHARDILAELEHARQGLDADEEPAPEGLRVGLTWGLVDRALGPLLASVAGDDSGIELSLVETGDPADVVDALLGRTADVALTSAPLVHEEIANAEIAEQRVVLIVRADSPLARGRRPPTLEELSRLPLVAWREGRDPSRFELELAERGLHANVVARAEGSDTVSSLVRAGLGAAVLPRSSVLDDDALAVIEFDEELPARSMGVAWLRGRSGEPAVRRFVDLACRLRGEL